MYNFQRFRRVFWMISRSAMYYYRYSSRGFLKATSARNESSSLPLLLRPYYRISLYPAMLKDKVPHVKLKLPLATKPDPPHISGVFHSAEEIIQAIQSWWSLKSSDILWVQNCNRLVDEHSVARDLVDFT
jgi:hypothetical protein